MCYKLGQQDSVKRLMEGLERIAEHQTNRVCSDPEFAGMAARLGREMILNTIKARLLIMCQEKLATRRRREGRTVVSLESEQSSML